MTPAEEAARLLLPRGCGFGQCERSRDRGGHGCDMCDRVAKLPQPKFKSRDALVEDVFEVGAEEAGPAVPQERKPAAPRKPVTTTTTKKRRPDKGPQTGSLLEYEPD